MKRMKQMLTMISISFVFVCIIFISIYAIHKSVIGGDASSGYIENEKYYVWVEDEIYKETSRQSWVLNKSLFIAMLIITPITICCLAYLGFTYYLPFLKKSIKFWS